MAYDPVSRKLSRRGAGGERPGRAPSRRFEHLDAHGAAGGVRRRRRALQGVGRDPANETRPISEAPDYLDRIALDSLLERRTWSE